MRGQNVALLTRNKKKREYEFVSKFYFSEEEVNWADIVGAIICTPTSHHLETLNKLVRRGIPTLVEKPISSNMVGVLELEDYVQKNNSQVMVGFNFRYHPHIKIIKEIIQNNKLGKIYYANFTWSDSIEKWYGSEYKNNYTSSKSLGGGALRTMCHELDLALWFFGEFESCKSSLKNLSSLKMNGVEDFFCGEINFRNGVFTRMQLDFITDIPNRNIFISSERGSVKWDYYRGKLHVRVNGQSRLIDDKEITIEYKNKMYIELIDDFIEMCNKNTHSKIPFKDGVNVQKIINKLSND